MNEPRGSDNPYRSPPAGDSPSGSAVKTLIAAVVGILSALYLINPTFGVFELIPDNLPVIGNLDEATATALLLSSLAYFGWDLRTLFGRKGGNLPQSRRPIDQRRPGDGE